MKKTKYFIYAVIVISLTFFGGVTYYSLARLKESRPSESVVVGKQIWQEKSCVGCHTIFGDGAYLASDLTHSISKSSPERIRTFLQNSEDTPTSTGKHPILTADEVEAVLHFLTYVDQLTIRDWSSKVFQEEMTKVEEDNSLEDRNSKE